MTNSEAIKLLKSKMDGSVDTSYEWCECVRMAIKALEQEPCEDAIDRAEAMTEIMMFAGNVKSDEEDIYIKVSDAVQLLRELPSVTPQQKVGKWINKYAEDACGERYSYWACSECGRDVGFNLANIENVLSDYPYCHCGAKMEEEEC